MKVWFKLLVGAVLGIVLAQFLPVDNSFLSDMLEWLRSVAIRIGRWTVVPLLIFSLSSAIFRLRDDKDKNFFLLLIQSCFFMICISAVLIAFGIIASALFSPSRIPIFIEERSPLPQLDTVRTLIDNIPDNMLAVLSINGDYLLPVCLFSFLSAIGFSLVERTVARQVLNLFDSLSRIFYAVAGFISEFLGLLMLVLAASWAIQWKTLVQPEFFSNLIIFLAILSGIIIFGFFPLLLYITYPKVNPFIVLYSSFASILTGFFSGDINFSLPIIMRHSKENLGVRRRSNVCTTALFALFGRSGSAMVAVVAFLVILKSYSSLELRFIEQLTIGIQALAASFLLARHPGDGAYTTLMLLCLWYGRGYESGFLIIKPIAFYLIALGTCLDVFVISCATFILSKKTSFQEMKHLRKFI
ncbi:MAG: dicarboxylate/amino acid:cation symporter [Treponema sp.]|jgi:Na+/H+-dicarboxylate symporter|nr:dicarboxylate/amino acid:cation symporter [Treponema sp.]